MRPKESVRPISYLKAHASKLIRDISRKRTTLVVTHNGEAKVVVQDIHTFEKTQEALALLKILVRSKENIRKGKSKPMNEAFQSLEKRIKALKDEAL
jgi:prevent-host-death family protein